MAVRAALLIPRPLVGRGRGGGREDRAANHLQHAIDVCQHLVVPEPQYTVALRFQKTRTPCISRDLLRVVPAVDLNRDAQLMAGEIDDVGTKAYLPAEMRAPLHRKAVRRCHHSLCSASVGARRMARARLRFGGDPLRSRIAQMRSLFGDRFVGIA